jgi:uncharacterized membrane protein
MNLPGLLRAAGTGLLLLAWIGASHLGSTGRGPVDLHVAVALAPLLAALAMLLTQCPWPALRWLAAAAAALCVWALWPWLRTQVALLYYLQHLGVHLALAVLFGATLRGPGDPLITRMARAVQGPDLSPRLLRYTRQATRAWVVFFLLNAAVSTGLFLAAPRELWSLHANVLTGPLLGLVFVLDALWRHLVLLPHERPQLSDVLRAWREDSKRREAARSHP